MEPYKMVRNIVEQGYEDHATLVFVVKMITSRVCPFAAMDDGKTIFEIAARKRRKNYVYMFVSAWALHPSWDLHDEVYKLAGERQALQEIEDYAMRHKDTNLVVNHLLNVLRVLLV